MASSSAINDLEQAVVKRAITAIETQLSLPNEDTPLLVSNNTENQYDQAESSADPTTPSPLADLELASSLLSNSSWTTLSALLVGVFLAQADQTLVLATYSTISSQFRDLSSGSWLISAYVASQCVSQPLYEKLSAIYGPKTCLQTSHLLFLFGTLLTGLGQNMATVLCGRAIQGLGGSGMVCVASLLIAELVPVGEAAGLRRYISGIQTFGRASGGVVGGFLTVKLGWRWAFLLQIPFAIASILLVHFKVHVAPRPSAPGDQPDEPTHWEKLRQIDFHGALTLPLSLLGTCLTIDLGANRLSWTSPLLALVGTLTFALHFLFVLSHNRIVRGASAVLERDPIFPLHLLSHPVVFLSYLLLILQNVMSMTLVMLIPMYFQVTNGSNVATAGAYLVPSFVGNAVGGHLAGWFISETGLHKIPTVASQLCNVLCFTLLQVLWNGNTPAWQSLFVFFGGFATGVSHSSVFVGLTSGVKEEHVAAAGSGLHLSGNIGSVFGSSISSALFEATLRPHLETALQGVPNKDKIIRKALANIGYVQDLSPDIRDKVMPAYITGFQREFWMCLGCAGLSLVLAVVSRGTRIERNKT